MTNTLRYDNFWAGISQDDRLQSKGEYTYGRDIDIRQWQFVQLEKCPINLYSASESWSIVSQFYGADSKYYLGCSDGIIRRTTDFSSYESLYTLPSSESVLNIIGTDIAGVRTLFFWTENYMYYRTTYTDGAAWVTAANTIQVTSQIDASLYRQVIHYASKLIYFTNGKTIAQLDVTTPGTVVKYGSFTSGWGAFEARGYIVGISEHANSFWVYDVEWRMYVIDQSIQAVSSVKNFKEPIIGVYNNSDFDMVITQSWPYYKAAYLNGGVWPNSHTLLRRYMYSQYGYTAVGGTLPQDGIRFNFTMKASVDASFCENNTIIYFTANEGWQDVIYSYGRKNNSLPASLSIISSKNSSAATWGTISAIFVKSSYLYVVGNSGVTRYVERIPIEDVNTGATYQASGYLITRVDTLGIFEQPKKAWPLRLGAYIPTWTAINISYSMDERAFILIDSIWPTEILGWTTIASLISRNVPSVPYNELAIKLELVTTNSSVTPRLFSLEYLPQTALSNKPQ